MKIECNAYLILQLNSYQVSSDAGFAELAHIEVQTSFEAAEVIF